MTFVTRFVIKRRFLSLRKYGIALGNVVEHAGLPAATAAAEDLSDLTHFMK
jgi:hypothetical protein